MVRFPRQKAPQMSVSSHVRSVAKAVSWRVVGSLDTFLVAWVLTGKPGAAGAIASAEVLTKTALYYCHERVWAWVPESVFKFKKVAIA